MESSLRIVYMGTPDFAVPTLDRLVTQGYNVVGVVTMPDKAIGRHHDQLQSSPVKQYAVQHDIPVLQPEKLRDEAFLQQLRGLQADLQIVVAFRMLPQVVWDMPRLGTFNLHAALLPQYRGAAPLNWAVINGDRETGLTTFFLDKDIDTGRIILQERIPIGDEDCVGDVHDRLMERGALLVQQTVDLIESGQAQSVEQSQFMQPGVELRPAPKIFRETCEIRWAEHTLDSVHNFIRGLSPYPAAWCSFSLGNIQDQVIKIFQARRLTPQEGEDDEYRTLQPGTFQTDGRSYLRVAMPQGWLQLLEVQISGKKRMKTEDFLRGMHF